MRQRRSLTTEDNDSATMKSSVTPMKGQKRKRTPIDRKVWTLTLVIFCVCLAIANSRFSSQSSTAAPPSGSHASINVGPSNSDQNLDKDNKNQQRVSVYPHLSCEAYGGPSDEFAQEMVYWQWIPSDTRYVSPYRARNSGKQQYLTFEPDIGGFNNIRMALEVMIGIAIATGRTLVMPPAQKLYLLDDSSNEQRTHFSFADFYDLEGIARHYDGLDIISMEEFLETEAMTGNLHDKETNDVSFPPNNRVNWEGDQDDAGDLKDWLRTVSATPLWKEFECLAAFPQEGSLKRAASLDRTLEEIYRNVGGQVQMPGPVIASPMDRMKEELGGRRELCMYDEDLQDATVLHLIADQGLKVRFVTHFYSFLFFEDWRESLWVKRFMRDNMRYIDEIQCAAARLVHAMREYSISKGNPDGEFDTFHIRRGDFQYTELQISAQEIYENIKEDLEPGATVYIATDERDKSFFDDLKKYYDVKFMDDFMPLLDGVNTNYYGMVEQLVASRGRNFFGVWYSTFTGYIMRLRGYHSVKEQASGYEKGRLPNTFYYAPKEHRYDMHQYTPLRFLPYFAREFPTSWRDLDKGVGLVPNYSQSS